MRFNLKNLGIRMRSPNTNIFVGDARPERAGDHAEVLELVEPSLTVIDTWTCRIKRGVDDGVPQMDAGCDRRIEVRSL